MLACGRAICIDGYLYSNIDEDLSFSNWESHQPTPVVANHRIDGSPEPLLFMASER